MSRRILSFLSALVVLILWAPIDAAQDAGPCAATLPDGDWRLAGQTDLVTVYGVDLTEAVGLRLAEEAAATARMLEADFALLPRLTLCVVGFQADVDVSPLTGGEALHSAVLNDEAATFLSMVDGALFAEAHAFGMASAVLWHVAAGAGLEGYPEPLATTIGQWYMSRNAGSEGVHHTEMRDNAFFLDPGGEGIAPANWAASSQPRLYLWNPQFQESAAADMIRYAVEREGVDVLSDPDPRRWAALEVTWQAELRDEALQGRESGNNWLIGLGILVGVVILGLVTALLTRRSRRRVTTARRAAARRAAGVPEDANRN